MLHFPWTSSADPTAATASLIGRRFGAALVCVSSEGPAHSSSAIILGRWPQIKAFLSFKFGIKSFIYANDTRCAVRQEMKHIFALGVQKC